jgi:hypothetical protein
VKTATDVTEDREDADLDIVFNFNENAINNGLPRNQVAGAARTTG